MNTPTKAFVFPIITRILAKLLKGTSGLLVAKAIERSDERLSPKKLNAIAIRV
jgi:hypothetical protein